MTALDRLKQRIERFVQDDMREDLDHEEWGESVSPHQAAALLAVVEAAVKWRDAHEVVSTASTPRRIAVVKISPCTDEEIDLAAAIDAMRKEVGQ